MRLVHGKDDGVGPVKLLMFGHWTETGFGVVTKRLAEGFLKRGVDVRVIASNYRGEPLHGLMAGRVWHAGLRGDPTGGNISHEAAVGALWDVYHRGDKWQPDVALFIADTGSLTSYLGRPRMPGKDDSVGPFGRLLPAFVYTPIEGDRLPPIWTALWQHISPIAMSNFGKAVIDEVTRGDTPMFYHGVDTQVFRPPSKKDPIRPAENPNIAITTRLEAKRACGLDPTRKHILRADRLTQRKNYWALFQSVLPVMELMPDLDLVIHCAPIDDGFNLHHEISRLPQYIQKRVILTGAHDTWQGVSAQGLAALYAAADVYVSPTGGEGFGLTLAESVACGTPVVTTNYAAGPEVVGPGGWLVPPLKDMYGGDVRDVNKFGMDWRIPDVRAFTSQVLLALNTPQQQLDAMMAEGREHIMKSFSWNATVKGMHQLLEQGVKDWHGSHSNGSGSQDVPTDPISDHDARRALAAAHPSGGIESGATVGQADLVK
jgi:glycosyltransferase involved in cell wall biosynthesis